MVWGFGPNDKLRLRKLHSMSKVRLQKFSESLLENLFKNKDRKPRKSATRFALFAGFWLSQSAQNSRRIKNHVFQLPP